MPDAPYKPVCSVATVNNSPVGMKHNKVREVGILHMAAVTNSGPLCLPTLAEAVLWP